MHYTNVKAIKYLDTTHGLEGYHRIACKLSTPWVNHQIARLLQAAQGVHGCEYQGIQEVRHYDGMW